MCVWMPMCSYKVPRPSFATEKTKKKKKLYVCSCEQGFSGPRDGRMGWVEGFIWVCLREKKKVTHKVDGIS